MYFELEERTVGSTSLPPWVTISGRLSLPFIGGRLLGTTLPEVLHATRD